MLFLYLFVVAVIVAVVIYIRTGDKSWTIASAFISFFSSLAAVGIEYFLLTH